MLDVIIWWVLVELVGLAVLPVAFRFFRNLPDRGYAFIKPLGLLLIAYPFWLLTTLGFLTNTRGAIALVGVLVAALSWGVLGKQAAASRQQAADSEQQAADSEQQAASSRQHPSTPLRSAQDAGSKQHPSTSLRTGAASDHATRNTQHAIRNTQYATRNTQYAIRNTIHASLTAWLRANTPLLLTTELVFTLAFFGWALVRAYMPEITATEKPMEFAFLNGVLQSTHFPPHDPWLSGYAISYYYFGYIIVAMLTLLSGVASSVAFNLAIALLFGLSATGAFGLAYNLIRNAKFVIRNSLFSSPESLHHATRNTYHASRLTRPCPERSRRDASRFTQPLFFALFAPIFLLLIGNLEGFFEALHARGIGAREFWNWLDIKGLAQAPITNMFVPTDNWWWWRASRVIHDVALGQTQEVIDEFPQFAFLLGDMHPHVLALPFVLLALAAALNLLNSKFKIQNSKFSFGGLNFELRILNLEFLLLPLVLGGLFCLNSWDILPYGFIIVVAYAIARYRAGNDWDAGATRDLVIFVVALGVLSIVLYVPFYIGFQTQAGGILPVLFVKTRLHQYLIMFGLFVFILGAFLARLVYEHRAMPAREWLSRAAPFLAAAVAFPIAVAALALGLLTISPSLQEQARAAFPNAGDNFIANVLGAYFGPLAADPWLFILLAVLLTAILVLLRVRLTDDSTTFVLILAFTGLLLTFGVEFVYLRDTFGTRMNTVFKFYFQAWTLFSIAAAYAVFYLSRVLTPTQPSPARGGGQGGGTRGAWFIALAILLAASLVYPALAIPNRADGFKGTPTLDGIEWIRHFSPGDYAAIQWLNANAPRGATIVEAVGGEYSYGNRISMATGLATLLGWFGHELQWRGNTKLFKDDAAGIDRGADIQRIYQTLDTQELLTLLDKYGIQFVVVGATERSQYGLSKAQVDKFGKVLTLVFESGDVHIYAGAY